MNWKKIGRDYRVNGGPLDGRLFHVTNEMWRLTDSMTCRVPLLASERGTYYVANAIYRQPSRNSKTIEYLGSEYELSQEYEGDPVNFAKDWA